MILLKAVPFPYHSAWFRFAEAEGVAILVMIASRYKIEIKDDPKFADETYEERWRRVLEIKDGITIA